MGKKTIPPDTRDAKKIRKLETALYLARSTIISLIPESLQRPLEAAIYCISRQDIHDWERWAIERVMAQAVGRPGLEMGAPGQTRAYCPLCGGGSQAPYTSGFAMPTGMRRHLEGSHGSHRCAVFSAAIDPCFEKIEERAEPGYRGPNWEGLCSGLPPWKIVPPEPVRTSAIVINFPGK